MALISQSVDGERLDQLVQNRINTNEIMDRIRQIKKESEGVIGGPDGEYIALSALFKEIADIGIDEMAKAAAVHVKRKPPMSEVEFAKLFSSGNDESEKSEKDDFIVNTHRDDHKDGGFAFTPGYSQEEFDALPPATQILRIADETVRVIVSDKVPANGKESVIHTMQSLQWVSKFVQLIEKYLGVQYTEKFTSILGSYAEQLEIYQNNKNSALWMPVQMVRNEIEDEIKMIMNIHPDKIPELTKHEPKIDIVIRSNGRQQGASYLSNTIYDSLKILGYRNLSQNNLQEGNGSIHSHHRTNYERNGIAVQYLLEIPITIEIEQFDNEDKQWRDGKGNVIGERKVKFDFDVDTSNLPEHLKAHGTLVDIPKVWPSTTDTNNKG